MQGPPRFVPQPLSALALSARDALTAGLAISSAGSPALDAVYPCDPYAAQQAAMVASHIDENGRFPVVTIFHQADATGTNHSFSTEAFVEFSLVLNAYTSTLVAIANGKSELTTLPLPSSSIL